MHPHRTDTPRLTRRQLRYQLAVKLHREQDLERQAQGYRLERQALAAAEFARMVAIYQTHTEA